MVLYIMVYYCIGRIVTFKNMNNGVVMLQPSEKADISIDVFKIPQLD